MTEATKVQDEIEAVQAELAKAESRATDAECAVDDALMAGRGVLAAEKELEEAVAESRRLRRRVELLEQKRAPALEKDGAAKMEPHRLEMEAAAKEAAAARAELVGLAEGALPLVKRFIAAQNRVRKAAASGNRIATETGARAFPVVTVPSLRTEFTRPLRATIARVTGETQTADSFWARHG